MKKFITIPYDVYERLLKSSNNPDSIESIPTKFDSTLQRKSTVENTVPEKIEFKLSEILNSEIPVSKKRMLYTDVLRKFIDVNETHTENESNNSVKEQDFNPSIILTDILPKTVIKKGISFLNYLNLNRDISWDKAGVVTIDENIIPGSNIIDYISHSVRNISTRPDPIGFKIFRNWLIKQNVPITYIGNNSILNQILSRNFENSNNIDLTTRNNDQDQTKSTVFDKDNKIIKSRIKGVRRKLRWSPF